MKALIFLSLYIDNKHHALVSHLRDSRQSILTGMLLFKLAANCVNRMHLLIGYAQDNVFGSDIHYNFTLSLM